MIASGGFQNNLVGTQNQFLVKFNPAGSRLCATYYGQWWDGPGGVAVDNNSNVYLGAFTQSTINIASAGFQNTFGGTADADLVKFTSCSNNTLSIIPSSTNILCYAQCNGSAKIIPTSGTAPYTYTWNTSPAQATQTATGLCAGSYTVTVTDATNTTATSLVTITQPTVLTASITSSTPTLCNSNTGSATVALVGGTPGYTYSWSPIGGTAATASNLAPGTYTVTTTDANGCSQTATATIVQQSILTSSATSTASSCSSNTGTAIVTPANGTPNYSYNWSPSGGNAATAIGLAPGTYTVTVTDANGCTSTSTAIVASTPGPTAVVSSNIIIVAGSSTILTASGGGTYNWIPSIDLGCSTCTNPTATPAETTTYCVEVTDNNGCKDSACVKVTVEIPCISNLNSLTVPNAFSPNADGVNDEFCLQGWNYCVDEFSVSIYDRWGEKVFQSTDPDFCWDGKYLTKTMDAQVFVYYIKSKFTNKDKVLIKKGNISLIR